MFHRIALAVLLAVLLDGCPGPSTPDAPEPSDAESLDTPLDGPRSDAPVAGDAPSDAPPTPPVCTGTVFHVATTGDDAGDGTAARPFRTLAHAAATVTTPGSTIHLAAGTYEETSTADLAPGVCLEGEGPSTVLQSTLTAEFTPMLRLGATAEGTAGDQSISALTFDGRLSTRWGIEIRGRSDVSIHDCTFTELFDSAVFWGGRVDGVDGAPVTYATGNSFHHNTVENSAHCDAVYCRGAVVFGGQDGMQITDNTISTVGRAPGAAGWPIKGQVNDGYNRNLLIARNTLVATNDAPFDFAIELFHVTGVEITENDITGSIDSNFQTATDRVGFGMRIHHNRIRHVTHSPGINYGGGNAGVILEFATGDVEVHDNHVDTVSICFMFTPRAEHIGDVWIHHNLCEGVHVDGTRLQNEMPFTASDVRIDHNTILGPVGGRGTWGIGLSGGGGSTDFFVRNNVVRGFVGGVSVGPGPSVTGLTLQNNVFFDCGDGMPNFAGGMPSGTVVEGTLTSDPLLTGEDQRPGDGSPAIDSGVDVGLPSLGAAPDRGWIEVR